MDYVIAIGFIFAMAGMIAAGIWQTKKRCEEERLNSQAIWALYKEVKRYNDKTFGEEQKKCNP